MQTFAQKPNLTPGRAFINSAPASNLRKTGNQSARRSPGLRPEDQEADPATDQPGRFTHDFSRIPVSAGGARKIQTKLTVNTPGDEYEQEADRVADEVMRAPRPRPQRKLALGGQWLGHQADPPGQGHGFLQTRRGGASRPGQTAAPPIVHEVLNSPGRPLDAGIRFFMEGRFGHDFSRVRVHADAKAAESARAVSALAYSAGRDIVFEAGRYAPETRDGQRLLAHELAHFIQQRGEQISRREEVTRERGRDKPVDPRECPNAHDAIKMWGFPQAVEWVKMKNARKDPPRPAVVLHSKVKVWKTFDEWNEVDIDIPFQVDADSPVEHVKWRVRPVRKNGGQWVLQSTITEWWDGNPVVFYLPDGLAKRTNDHCKIDNASPRKPPPEEKRREPSRGRQPEVPV